MHLSKVQLLVSALLTGISTSCNNIHNSPVQMYPPDSNQFNRQAFFAGQFYPKDSLELQSTITSLYKNLTGSKKGDLTRAVIVPHAGYVFSGEVAVAGFKQLDPEKEYKRVFILGCSHRSSFRGAAVYSAGHFTSPLGIAKVDLNLAAELSGQNPDLNFNPSYHNQEHSIEVQIPFLQHRLKKPFLIVPILLGTKDPEICKRIASILLPYFTEDNLFVISTDFSHYPGYADAEAVDDNIAIAITANNPARFIEAEKSCLRNDIPGLLTGCCSWPAVLTLLYMTEALPGLAYNRILYKNSGDSEWGDRDRVVGYHAISVTQKKTETETILSESEKSILLQWARISIEEYLKTGRTSAYTESPLSEGVRKKAGAFVTLRKNGELRGCIGHFEPDYSLYQIIQKMAIAAATEDSRFQPLTLTELDSVDIEISVLTPLRRIHSENEVRLGTDGIYMKKGQRSGTFLPQVAEEMNWTLDEFLGYCSRNKVGIGWDGWKDKETELYTYQAIIFHE